MSALDELVRDRMGDAVAEEAETELYELRLALGGGILICDAFLAIKDKSDEKDEPVPNVYEWRKNARSLLPSTFTNEEA